MLTLDDLPCGALELDVEGVVLHANAEAGRLLEASPSALVGQRLVQLLTPASRLFFLTQVFPTLGPLPRAEELYLTFVTGSGAERPVLATLGRVADSGRYACTFNSVQRRAFYERELTEAQSRAESAAAAEVVAETRLARLQAQLLAQERLASIGALSAGVAHEVNNPLSYAIGNVDLALDHLTRDATPSRASLLPLLEDAHDGLDRIRGIIDGLRGLSRVQARRVPVDLQRVVDTALRLAGHELRRHAEVRCEADSSAVVEADEGRLVQVFVNLLVNAAQAFAARGETTPGHVTVRTTVGEGVQVEVIDDGPGIPAPIQAHVFDPFFTTKETGTGLGLPICQSIVRGLGGELSFDSLPGRGTTFRITLPRSHREPARPAERRTPAPPARPQRALVVDAEPSVGRLLARALTGFDVTVVATADEALAQIRGGLVIDIIVCEMMLGPTTGADLHAAIEAFDPDLAARMVFTTGGATSLRAGTFLARHSTRRLDKPFRIADVRARCEAVLAARRVAKAG